MSEPIRNRAQNRFPNHARTRSGTTDQIQNQIQTVLSAVCGVSGSKSIHLTVTYPTAWKAATPRFAGVQCP